MTSRPLPKERFALLFAVMLVAAAGNTAMQSLMPAIGRELRVPDLWVGGALSLSAVVWVLAAPHWARRSDRRGRRALMRLGLSGFIGSMLVCGGVLAAALGGLLSAGPAFLLFVLGRALYGGFGSASPAAVQAYIAARTSGKARTDALSAIASSFGLGTIIGPALAPLFIFQPLGLAGPLVVFAAIGVVVLAALVLRLPDDTPRSDARGEIAPYPSLGSAAGASIPRSDAADGARLGWSDPRTLPWLVTGTVGGHGQAAVLGVVGFLVIDRLGVPLSQAQQSIGVVLMVGAAVTLLAQWWLIPMLGLGPRLLVLWGCVLAALGALVAAWAAGLYAITLGYAAISLGFGFFRPGFTSGASLAVEADEQNAVAGMVTSVNGIAYVAAPAGGVALYELWKPLPFLFAAALMLGLAAWLLRRLRA